MRWQDLLPALPVLLSSPPPTSYLHHVESLKARRERHPVVIEHSLHAGIPALEVDRLAATPSALLRSNGVQVRSAAHDYGGDTIPHPAAIQEHAMV